MNISDKGHVTDLAGLLSGLHDVTKIQAKVPKVEPKADQQDKVKISAQAKEFQRAYELINQAPDIRTDKLAPLEEAIRTGTYNVRGEQVANKLIEQAILDTIL
jgi:negative regulator of flagellin synthesis FlgM